jgi:hypothetical protein
MMRALILGTSLLCGVAAAETPDEKTQLALELMEVSQADKTFEMLEPMLRQQMMNSLSSTMGCKAAQPVIESVSTEFAATFSASVDVEKLKVDAAAIYAETFEVDELRALVDFYRSPVGRKMMSRMPELMQQSMSLMQDSMKDMMPRIEKIVDAHRDDLAAAGKACKAEATKTE